MLSIFLGLTIGLFFGVITGLIPGLHTNTVSLMLISLVPRLEFSSKFTVSLIISMALSNSFLSIIPSVFLGAPSEGHELTVLPGHRLLLEGKGLEAVKLNLFGSVFALVFSSLLLIPLLFILPFLYQILKPNIFLILLAISLFMVFRESNKLLSLLIFLLSGFLGYFTLESNVNEPFLPLLTGFFGISTLLISIKEFNFIPLQDFNAKPSTSVKDFFKSGIIGQISGFFISVLPGIGSSVAAIVSMRFVGKSEDAFLILTGCINTANFILSLVTFYTIDKARNGSIIALRELFPDISFYNLLFFLGIILIAGFFSFFITLWISKLFCRFIQKVNYRRLVIFVISFLVFLVILFSGTKGFLILLIAVSIGITPALGLTSRSLCIACILLPVMIFFQNF